MQRKNCIRNKIHQKINELDFSVKTTKIRNFNDAKVDHIFWGKKHYLTSISTSTNNWN